MNDELSDRDHDLMDAFLGKMADALLSARLSKQAFVEAMAYVMTALDIDNRDEARFCFQAGLAHFEGYKPEPRAAAAPQPAAASSPSSSGSIIVLSEHRAGARGARHPENGPSAETRAPRRSR